MIYAWIFVWEFTYRVFDYNSLSDYHDYLDREEIVFWLRVIEGREVRA